jgi:hypothetical protein
MSDLFHKKVKPSVKAALLFVIYLLHFLSFQNIVAGYSGAHSLIAKTFSSQSSNSQNSNKGIATFRTLEKHEICQYNFKLTPKASLSRYKVFDLFTSLVEDRIGHFTFAPTYFHLSDIAYRLYLMVRVFLI